MKITQLEHGTPVNVNFKTEKEIFIIESFVYKRNINGVKLLIPLNGDYKNINNAELEITSLLLNTPYNWKITKSKLVDNDDTRYLVIFEAEEGVYENKRNAYRVPIGVEGVYFNNVRKPILPRKCVITDLSISGVGFECEESIQVGDSISILFKDDNTNYQLICEIVRAELMDGEVIKYGAKLDDTKITSLISKFIHKKQLEEMRKKAALKDF